MQNKLKNLELRTKNWASGQDIKFKEVITAEDIRQTCWKYQKTLFEGKQWKCMSCKENILRLLK